MASGGAGSTSPQWDNRNRGFVPPAQFQQLRQQSRTDLQEFPRSPPPGQGQGQLQQQQSPYPQGQPQYPQQQQQQHQYPPGGQQYPQGQPPLYPQKQSQDPQRPTSPLNPNSLVPPQAAPQPRPRMPSSAGSGSRTSSFFNSFRRSVANLDRTSDDYDEAGAAQPQPQPQPRRSTTSVNNHGPPPVSRGPGVGGNGPTRSPSLLGGGEGAPPLHPEIRSIVQLTVAHAHKVYFSGPLIRRIERNADGQKPAKDEGWQDVWAQLGGTTLSIWDMKQVEEASKNGKEVPPTYVNVTDAVRPNIYIQCPLLFDTFLLVCSRTTWRDRTSARGCTSEALFQCLDTQHRRVQLTPLLVSLHGCADVLGSRPPPVLMGEVPHGRDLYRSPHPHHSPQRWEGVSPATSKRSNGGMGTSSVGGSSRLEEGLDGGFHWFSGRRLLDHQRPAHVAQLTQKEQDVGFVRSRGVSTPLGSGGPTSDRTLRVTEQEGPKARVPHLQKPHSGVRGLPREARADLSQHVDEVGRYHG